MQQFDSEISLPPGVANGEADAVSSRDYASSESFSLLTLLELAIVIVENAFPPLPTFFDLQRNDSDLVDIIAYLETSELSISNSKARELLHSVASFYLPLKVVKAYRRSLLTNSMFPILSQPS